MSDCRSTSGDSISEESTDRATLSMRAVQAAIDGVTGKRASPQFDMSQLESTLKDAPDDVKQSVRDLTVVIDRLWQLFGYSDDLSVVDGLADGARDIRHQIASASMIFQFATGVRLTLLLVDFAQCVERNRLLGAAISGRAAIATAASGAYLASKVRGILTDGHADADSQILGAIKKSLFGSRFRWETLLGADKLGREKLGKSIADDNVRVPSEEQSVNVLTMIKSLNKLCAMDNGPSNEVHLIYALLSDFAHPSAGTAFALLRPAEVPGSYRVCANSGIRSMGLFWLLAGHAVAPICETGMINAMECTTSLCEFYGD